MRLATVIGALIVSLLPAAGAGADDLKLEPDQRYLVLEVAKLATFETELKEAAKLGFRLMMSTTSEEGQRIQALMERVAVPPEAYEYRLVATFSKKTGSQELNAAGAQGFRVVPHTAMVKKGFTIFNTNTSIVMEKQPKSSDRFEYQAIEAVRTSTFHKELKNAVDAGWQVVDMTYGYIVLEKQQPPTSAP